jgi:hypothetical protein
MVKVEATKAAPQSQVNKVEESACAAEYQHAAMSSSVKPAEMRKVVCDNAAPKALNDVPIKNRALINHANEAYGAYTSEAAWNRARQEMQKVFGVDLAALERSKNGVSSIKVTNENAGALQHSLSKRWNGYAGPVYAQPVSTEQSTTIAKAIPVETVPNQKLINYAYNVLKVETRGGEAERQFKAMFGVELDTLIADRKGVSHIDIKTGPHGNAGVLAEILHSTSSPGVAAHRKSEAASVQQTASVTGREIARLYEKTADALIDALGGGREGRTRAARLLGAQGNSDRDLEDAIAKKVGSRYIRDHYDPASLKGTHRNSQFGVDAYRIDSMTQDLQKLVAWGRAQHEAAEPQRPAVRESTPRSTPKETVSGKDIASMYDRTEDAITKALGGGRAGREAAARFLHAQGTSEADLEQAIALKIGSKHFAHHADPARMRGMYRNSQFEVGTYRIDAMSQELQQLVKAAGAHHEALVKQHQEVAAREHARAQRAHAEHQEAVAHFNERPLKVRSSYKVSDSPIKQVIDRFTDPATGAPVMQVERKRLILGPIGFDLPGRRIEMQPGVPSEAAEARAKQYQRNLKKPA